MSVLVAGFPTGDLFCRSLLQQTIVCQTRGVSTVAWFSALAIGLLVWSVYWGIRIEKRLSGRLVSLARNNSRLGAAVAAGIQASALGGFMLLWLLGSLIGSIAGDIGVGQVPAGGVGRRRTPRDPGWQVRR